MFEQLPLEFQLLSALGFITFIVVVLGMLLYWFLVVKELVEEKIKIYISKTIEAILEKNKVENTDETETKEAKK